MPEQASVREDTLAPLAHQPPPHRPSWPPGLLTAPPSTQGVAGVLESLEGDLCVE